MSTIVVVTPNSLVDHLAVATVGAARVTRVPSFAAIAGGKGTNVGRVLARHGHRVVAVAFAGGASGERFGELVARDGLEPVLVRTAAPTRIGFQAVDPEGRGSAALLEGGFAVTPAEVAAMVAAVASVLGGADLAIVGGSTPAPAADDLPARVLEACVAARVPCWVDSYGEAMARALAAPHPPALGKPNREEYGTGQGWRACPEVHVTDGPYPVIVRLAGRSLRVVPPAVQERNAIGCGDSYLGALAHARLSGAPLEEQLAYAAAAGAANAARDDVANLDPAEIARLAKWAVVEDIPRADS